MKPEVSTLVLVIAGILGAGCGDDETCQKFKDAVKACCAKAGEAERALCETLAAPADDAEPDECERALETYKCEY